MTRCGTCGTTWHGLTECHCARCHQHFGSVRGFDEHRVGPDDDRRCADPATLIRADGSPRLVGVPRGDRTVWIGNDPRPHPKARERNAPGTASGNGGASTR